ncbi:MAG: glycosyltransferase [Blautia sp.]
MKKIIIVMYSLENGGAEKSLVNFLNELPEQKYEISLLLFKKTGVFLAQVPDFVNILETPDEIKRLYGPIKNSGRYMIFRIIANLFSLRYISNPIQRRIFRWKYFYSKCIKKIDNTYDIGLAYVSDEIMYVLDEKIESEKKIVMVHNDYRSGGNDAVYDEPYFQRMNKIVSISPKCTNILKEVFPQFKNKIVMVENITSSTVVKQKSEEFYPKEYSKENLVFLSIGRLTEQKGFDIAVSAAAIMKQKGLKFKWYIVGNGHLENKIKELIRREKVEDCFVLLGIRENPYPYIKNSTIFIQPSRYEGKSVVLDEAKILAKPILVTAYPTVRDQIKNGKEGVIVPMTPEGIVKGVEEYLSESDTYKKIEKYLTMHDYGNAKEVIKYMELLDE